MIYYSAIIKSLLGQSWFFPFVVIVSAIVFFLKPPTKENLPKAADKMNQIQVWMAAFVVFTIFAAPYWLFGSDAPHSGPDDVALTLHTYLSASVRGDSINWTNGILGGMDRWLLPNSYPL